MLGFLLFLQVWEEGIMIRVQDRMNSLRDKEGSLLICNNSGQDSGQKEKVNHEQNQGHLSEQNMEGALKQETNEIHELNKGANQNTENQYVDLQGLQKEPIFEELREKDTVSGEKSHLNLEFLENRNGLLFIDEMKTLPILAAFKWTVLNKWNYWNIKYGVIVNQTQ